MHEHFMVLSHLQQGFAVKCVLCSTWCNCILLSSLHQSLEMRFKPVPLEPRLCNHVSAHVCLFMSQQVPSGKPIVNICIYQNIVTSGSTLHQDFWIRNQKFWCSTWCIVLSYMQQGLAIRRLLYSTWCMVLSHLVHGTVQLAARLCNDVSSHFCLFNVSTSPLLWKPNVDKSIHCI